MENGEQSSSVRPVICEFGFCEFRLVGIFVHFDLRLVSLFAYYTPPGHCVFRLAFEEKRAFSPVDLPGEPMGPCKFGSNERRALLLGVVPLGILSFSILEKELKV